MNRFVLEFERNIDDAEHRYGLSWFEKHRLIGVLLSRYVDDVMVKQ